MNIYIQKKITVLILFFLLCPLAAFADSTFSGTLYLPDKTAVDREVTAWVGLCNHNWECDGGNVTIPQGATGIEFNVTTTKTSDVSLQYNTYGQQTGDIIYPQAYSIPPSGRTLNSYTDEGTMWFPDNTTISGISFEMYGGTTVSGQINGPTSGFADNKTIYVGYRDIATGSSYTFYNQLPANTSSLTYEFNVPDTVQEYGVTYYWDYWNDTIPTGYVREAFYKGEALNKTTYFRNQASSLFTADGVQTDIDMTLLEGDAISGKVAIPSTFTESSDISIWIQITSPNRDIAEYREITIPPGDTDASFNISVPLLDPEEPVSLEYYSVSNSDNAYITPGYYSSNGTTLDYSLRETFYPSTPPLSADLTLVPASIFSGIFTVPSEITTTDAFTTDIYAYDESGWYLDSTQVTIPAGQTQVDWDLAIKPGSGNTTLQYSSVTPLPAGYVAAGYYHPGGSVGISSLAAPLSSDTSQGPLTFDLLGGHIISGTLHTADDITFSEDKTLYVAALSNSSQYQYSWSGTLAAGSTAISYNLTVPEDAAPFNIFYSWNGQAPDPFYRAGYYNSQGTVVDVKEAEPVSPTADLPDIDMTILRAFTISGKILFPTGISSPDDLPVTLGAVNETDEIYDTTVIILSNDTEVDYTVKMPFGAEKATVGYYIETMDLVHHGFYDIGGTVGLMQYSTMLDNTTDHTEKDITLIEGNALTGQIAIPDALPEDLPITLGTISSVDGVYHTTVVIAANDLQADYSVRFAPDMVPVSLGFKIPPEANLPTQGYYRSSSPGKVTGGLLLADTFVTDTTLDGIIIPAGNSVEGNVSLPADYTVNAPLPIRVGLIANPAVPDSLYWTTTVVIPPGETSTSYTARLVMDSDLYAGFINDDTPDLLPFGFYAGSGVDPSPVPNFTLTQLLDYSGIDFAIHSATDAMGDVNFDGNADLKDVILTLQILTGQPLSEDIIRQADVNGDGVLSLQEAIYALQKTAE